MQICWKIVPVSKLLTDIIQMMHSSECDWGRKCRTRAQPECDIYEYKCMNTSMNTSVRIQVFSNVFSCVNVQIVLPCKPFITYGTQKQLLLVTSFDFHFHWTLYTYTTDNYVAHQERHKVSWNLINCFITPAQLLLFQDNLSKPALERHKTRWVTVASTGQFVDRLNYAADRYPYKHLVTQFWQARCSSWHTTNSVKFCQLTYV